MEKVSAEVGDEGEREGEGVGDRGWETGEVRWGRGNFGLGNTSGNAAESEVRLMTGVG